MNVVYKPGKHQLNNADDVAARCVRSHTSWFIVFADGNISVLSGPYTCLLRQLILEFVG